MPQPQPACADKRSLIEDVRLAMKTIIELNNREMEAVIAGEFGKLNAIEEELAEARQWKYSVIDSYHKHVREHGC